jgi:hypothetical protein
MFQAQNLKLLSHVMYGTRMYLSQVAISQPILEQKEGMMAEVSKLCPFLDLL